MVYSNIGMIALLPFVVAMFYLRQSQWWQSSVIAVVSVALFAASGLFNLIVFSISMAITMIYFFAANKIKSPTALPLIFCSILIYILIALKYRSFIIPGSYLDVLFNSADVFIPLGISFYTFHLIGAIVDLRGRNLPYGFANIFLFGIFFPQLVAGPIVRYNQMAPQFEEGKQFRSINLFSGLHLFALGLAKKCFIADPVSQLVDPVFAASGSHPPLITAAAVLGFYVQVFADFSGYTDMALGVARVLGFRLPMNFRAPYLAASPVEFWSRWHMSLSLWVRDYLYIPLATWSARTFRDRRARSLTIFVVIMLVMALLGLWHGAAWRFVAFGIFHGLLIVVWRQATGGKRPRTRLATALSILLFQIVLASSFIVFRSPDFSTAIRIANDLTNWGEGLYGIENFGMAMVGYAAILVIQIIDINICNRAIAKIFRYLRHEARGQIIIASIFLITIIVRVTLTSDYGIISGVSLHAPREQFIYFDF